MAEQIITLNPARSAPSVSGSFHFLALVDVLVLPLYAATLFLSSALLFVVEPMVAKMALPLLGGTPAVWNTCMVFFQACLLGGYAYAHFSIRWMGIRRQSLLQIALLLAALWTLPISMTASAAPPAGANPTGWLLRMLVTTLALPFFAVSTSGPVLQRWFTRTGHRSAADPYFLYAASNLGSMLALLAYPTLLERLLRLARQSHLWTAGYLLLIILTAVCAIVAWRPDEARGAVTDQAESITFKRRLTWIGLAFIPSSLLLGVTTFITTDIAAVPLLWVAPLALYLLSFIIVFAKRPIIPHALSRRALPVLILAVVLFLLGRVAQPLWMVLATHLAAFFFACLVCHGALAADRPGTGRLTDYYLMMCLGGMVGGLFNALLAPMIFSVAAEYPIGLTLAALFTPAKVAICSGSLSPAIRGEGWGAGRSRYLAIRPQTLLLPLTVGVIAWRAPLLLSERMELANSPLNMLAVGLPVLLTVTSIRRPVRFALCVGAMLIACVGAGGFRGDLLAVRRSFFGIHRIVRSPDGRFNNLYHGSTIHGRQFLDEQRQPVHSDVPLTYYTRSGPIGQVFASLPTLAADRHPRVAVVGLGIGSVAAYAQPGATFTCHEIDPVVIWAARDSGRFTFLRDAADRGANVRYVVGDARLTLKSDPARSCDLIILDAFSGDAVPAHLLTRQAMRIYLDKLTSDGVIAVHISNLYLDLKPVVAAMAADAGCFCYHRDDIRLTFADGAAGKMPSQWVIISRQIRTIAPLASDSRWTELKPPTGFAPWTDDFSNVISVFRWRQE